MNTREKQAIRSSAKKARATLDKKPNKRHRTLNLRDDSYLALAKYVAGTDLTVSEVVDSLIEAFMLEIDRD